MNIVLGFDKLIELKNNSLLKHRPDLFDEWDFKKNDELGIDIYRISYGSAKKVWWICPDCNSEFDSSINSRTGEQKSNCPYCSGKRVNHTNSLTTLNPELASEWHPTLNGELTPHAVTLKSGKKVWWLGQCGHEWDATVASRAGLMTTCPYCTNQKVLKGFNDMWTTNPELAKMLLNPEDGFKYTHWSGQKIDWKCATCSNNINNKRISDTNSKGVICPRCSDGISFPERFMYELLKEKSIEFVYDRKQKWSKTLRYDFYIPSLSTIIEVHGKQHYEEGFECYGGRTLQEEQENDRYKYELAMENGISKYVIIDAQESTVSHISKSINESVLTDIIGESIDFNEIGKKASKSMVKVACDIWNLGTSTILGIAEKMGLDSSTIRIYLKRGVEIGWCDYCPKEAMRENGVSAAKSRRRPIIQLDEYFKFIHEWNSATEAGKSLKIPRGNIPFACTGKRHTVSGFTWMYKEDYEKMIKEGSSHGEYMDKYYSKLPNMSKLLI